MSNTSIQLKKSGVTGNTPSGLNYGELALNYADGKLFYKNTSNSVSYISNQDSFSTISVGGNLILATSATDILSILSGNNVSITSNNTSKSITIGVNPVDTVTSNNISLVASAKSVNTVYTHAQAAFDYANTISGGASVDNVARSLAQTAYTIANDSIILAQAAFDKANTGVSTSSDQFARDTANAAFNAANTAQNSIPSLSGYATESFVTSQGYITDSILTNRGYATESFVLGKNYLTSSNLSGYATQTWVINQNYLTSSNLSGYATESFVTSQGYITGTPWQNEGYALQSFVDIVFNTANASFQQSNTTLTLAQAAFDKANTGTSSSIDQYARDTANSGTVLAQAAFNKANTNTGGTTNALSLDLGFVYDSVNLFFDMGTV